MGGGGLAESGAAGREALSGRGQGREGSRPAGGRGRELAGVCPNFPVACRRGGGAAWGARVGGYSRAAGPPVEGITSLIRVPTHGRGFGPSVGTEACPGFQGQSKTAERAAGLSGLTEPGEHSLVGAAMRPPSPNLGPGRTGTAPHSSMLHPMGSPGRCPLRNLVEVHD